MSFGPRFPPSPHQCDHCGTMHRGTTYYHMHDGRTLCEGCYNHSPVRVIASEHERHRSAAYDLGLNDARFGWTYEHGVDIRFQQARMWNERYIEEYRMGFLDARPHKWQLGKIVNQLPELD